MTRVLGIDPGTQRTGWGIVEVRRGRRLAPIASGIIRTGKRPLPARLKLIHDGLCGVMEEYAPVVLALEDIFMGKYANAALKLGHARGVVMVVAANAAIDVHEYPPAVVKRTVAGRGGADKDQVAKLVSVLLRLPNIPSADAADALAIAITHCQFASAARPSALARRMPRSV